MTTDKNLGGSILTDEQCDQFRRLPCSFNDMVRAIYLAGYRDAAKRAVEICNEWANFAGIGSASDEYSLSYGAKRCARDIAKELGVEG